MKISTRGRYGIRLLIDLAEHRDSGHVTLTSVAQRQAISVRYLEQVAIILRRAGFIRSIKGASGAYALAMPSNEIIIGNALRVLEGDMLIVDPRDPQTPESKFQRCIRRKIFDPLNKHIAEIIDRQTLASLVNTVDNNEAYMYFI
jgi:Rrf2 family protein